MVDVMKQFYSNNGQRNHAVGSFGQWSWYSSWEFYTKDWNIIAKVYSGNLTMHYNIAPSVHRRRTEIILKMTTQELYSKFVSSWINFISIHFVPCLLDNHLVWSAKLFIKIRKFSFKFQFTSLIAPLHVHWFLKLIHFFLHNFL